MVNCFFLFVILFPAIPLSFSPFLSLSLFLYLASSHHLPLSLWNLSN